MLEIKRNGPTIHSKSIYWEDKNGYRIAVVRGTNSYLSDSDLIEILNEQVEEYLNAKGLSIKDL